MKNKKKIEKINKDEGKKQILKEGRNKEDGTRKTKKK